MPSLKDSIFSESVILICDHNNDGAMGFITNKPISENIDNKIFQNISDKINSKVYFGGPVNLDICFILHDNSYSINKSI